ncbi:MAG: anti-sigma B factor antagonist [Lentimonas sp.]|jgi:anti-sigma B factor antagonist
MITSKVTTRGLEVLIDIQSIDSSNSAEVTANLKQLDLEGVSHVVLDLHKVEFVDSSGIEILLSLYKSMNQQLSLLRPSPTVLSVLELLRLDSILNVESE